VAPRERWNEVTLARFRAWIEQAIAEMEGGHVPGDGQPAPERL
jgi:hypothetical protein